MQLKVTMKLCSHSENEAKSHWASIPGAVIYWFGNAKMVMVGDTLVISFLKSLISCSSGLCYFRGFLVYFFLQIYCFNNVIALIIIFSKVTFLPFIFWYFILIHIGVDKTSSGRHEKEIINIELIEDSVFFYIIFINTFFFCNSHKPCDLKT